MGLTSKITALINYANETTAAGDTTLGDAVKTLCDGYGQGGGSVVDEMADVLFIDYDGTLIAGYTLEEAHALTSLPTPPEHEKLTFVEWNYTLAEINALTIPATIGACYTTYNGKCICKIACRGTMSVKAPAPFSGSIDWGDGTINTQTTHTYAEGTYFIEWNFSSLNSTATGGATNCYDEMYFPRGAFSRGYMNQLQRVYVRRIIFPIGLTVIEPGFFREAVVDAIILPRGFQRLEWQALARVLSRRLSFPNTLAEIGFGGGSSTPNYNYALARLDFPQNLVSFGGRDVEGVKVKSLIIPEGVQIIPSSFGTDSQLGFIDLPSTLTKISSYGFERCYVGTIILRSTNCVLDDTNAFSGGYYDDMKIYVPDSAVGAYKTASNWSTFAERIYPLSEFNN